MTTMREVPELWMLDTIPEAPWVHGDDACDCTFQRIAIWTNPYLGRSLQVRLCCIWREIYGQYPQYVREVPATYDPDKEAFTTGIPADWDGDHDMPRHLWHRQVSVQLGIPLSQVRKLLEGQEPPKAVGKKATARRASHAQQKRA